MPHEVPVDQGGTRQHPLAVNAWLHFSWVSNELGNARVLFCPSDEGRPARDFTGDPKGGYVHPNFANNATSYLLAHTVVGRPRDIFVADRNFGWSAVGGCSRFNLARQVDIYRWPSLGRWNATLHNEGGNILTFDGGVDQVNNSGLPTYLGDRPVLDNGNFHFIVPR